MKTSMKYERDMPKIENPEQLKDMAKLKLKSKLNCLLEVSAVFFLMHISMRLFKQYTTLGEIEKQLRLNFSPGILMTMISASVLTIRRTKFRDAGLTLTVWPISPNLPSRRHRLSGAIIIGILWGTVFLRGWGSERGLFLTILTACSRFFAVGFGEEIFFRGYMQSTLNQSFFKDFECLGAKFGWGLILSSAFFGLIHALNTVDYFNGLWQVSWSWGIGTFFAGLFFGYLRERSGRCLLGSLVHASRGLLSVFIPVPVHL